MGDDAVPASVSEDVKATLELLQINTNCFSMLLVSTLASKYGIIQLYYMVRGEIRPTTYPENTKQRLCFNLTRS